MATTTRLNVSPEPDDFETVYGRAVFSVGRTRDGVIASQGEFDDDVFCFEPDDANTLTTMVLDAWDRSQKAEDIAREVGR